MNPNLLQDRSLLHDRHRLSHKQISRLTGKEDVPLEILLKQKMQCLRLVNDFLEVPRWLRRTHFFSFPKRAFALLPHFRGLEIRISHDIDHLIGKDDLDHIMDVLTQHGFYIAEDYYWPQKAAQRKILFKTLHHIAFHHIKHSFCVEIHWGLMNELSVSEKKTEQLVAADTKRCFFHGQEFTVLNKNK